MLLNKTRIFFALSLLFYTEFISAQDDIDAMRYSQTSFYGDSRFMSMAGSFGALGANLSCMNFNPAGIAMYRNGEFVFTPGIKLQTTNATHYDNNTTDFASKVNISTIGFVSAWDSKNTYPTSSKQYANFNQRNAFGISYNRMADFNTNTTIEGYPVNSSIINDFANVAQGYYPSQLISTYEGLAYQTYLINSTADLHGGADSNHYKGAGQANIPLLQNKTIKSSGRMGELAFSFAHAFNDKLYLGATLGIPLVKYNRQATYSESDYKSKDSIFRSLKYDEQLLTSGSGYNLKLGAIYRVNENIRVGGYVHTPTVLNLTDNYQYSIDATFHRAINTFIPTSAQTTDNMSMQATGYYKYKITTPARAGASVCYIYNKLLAVNLDAEYVSYSSAKMKGVNDNSLDALNLTIASKYASTTNIRIGAELNVRPVVIRAGFATYGSPFGPAFTGKFVRNTFSAGVGFRGPNNVYLDLGLMYTQWKEDYYLFAAPYVNATQIANSVIYFTATLGVKFN